MFWFECGADTPVRHCRIRRKDRSERRSKSFSRSLLTEFPGVSEMELHKKAPRTQSDGPRVLGALVVSVCLISPESSCRFRRACPARGRACRRISRRRSDDRCHTSCRYRLSAHTCRLAFEPFRRTRGWPTHPRPPMSVSSATGLAKTADQPRAESSATDAPAAAARAAYPARAVVVSKAPADLAASTG